MSPDTMKVFNSFLREWCESRGWPYQPEMTAQEQIDDSLEQRYAGCSHTPQRCTCGPFMDAETLLRARLRDAQEYWAEIEGTDEWELANLHEIEENDD